jgi:iron complex outermembrane receptor protein
VGAALRPFVRDYAGVTRLGAWLDLTLWRATALTLRGDNLLGRQLGEPDNVTVLPGRTVIVGVRTGF